MKPDWTLRQVLAILRGVGLMVALFLALILLQLVPSLFRGGISGVQDHIERVAITGVPPEHWPAAIARMYGALIGVALFGCVLFLAQRYLGRKLAGNRPSNRPFQTTSH
jgi:hypothetical protein